MGKFQFGEDDMKDYEGDGIFIPNFYHLAMMHEEKRKPEEPALKPVLDANGRFDREVEANRAAFDAVYGNVLPLIEGGVKNATEEAWRQGNSEVELPPAAVTERLAEGLALMATLATAYRIPIASVRLLGALAERYEDIVKQAKAYHDAKGDVKSGSQFKERGDEGFIEVDGERIPMKTAREMHELAQASQDGMKAHFINSISMAARECVDDYVGHVRDLVMNELPEGVKEEDVCLFVALNVAVADSSEVEGGIRRGDIACNVRVFLTTQAPEHVRSLARQLLLATDPRNEEVGGRVVRKGGNNSGLSSMPSTGDVERAQDVAKSLLDKLLKDRKAGGGAA